MSRLVLHGAEFLQRHHSRIVELILGQMRMSDNLRVELDGFLQRLGRHRSAKRHHVRRDPRVTVDAKVILDRYQIAAAVIARSPLDHLANQAAETTETARARIARRHEGTA